MRNCPEVRYTLTTINTGSGAGQNLRQRLACAWSIANSRQRGRDVGRAARAPAPDSGITVTHVGLLDPVGGQKQIEFSPVRAPTRQELARLDARAVQEKIHAIPGLVDLDSSVKPDKPVDRRRCAATRPPDLGLSAQMATSLRTLIAGQTVGNWRAPRRDR